MPTYHCVALTHHVFGDTSTGPSVADLVAFRGEGETVILQILLSWVTPKQNKRLPAFTGNQNTIKNS